MHNAFDLDEGAVSQRQVFEEELDAAHKEAWWSGFLAGAALVLMVFLAILWRLF